QHGRRSTRRREAAAQAACLSRPPASSVSAGSAFSAVCLSRLRISVVRVIRREASLTLDIRQKRRKYADSRKKRAQAVHVLDSGDVGEPPEHGRTEAAHPKRKAEEEARYQPN